MSNPTSGIALPAILIANDLRDGDVVVRSDSGWSRDPREAVIAHDRATADRLAAEAEAELAANRVVDAYLIDVTLGGAGEPVPNHFRERFKLRGPSIRPDLARVPGGTAAGLQS